MVGFETLCGTYLSRCDSATKWFFLIHASCCSGVSTLAKPCMRSGSVRKKNFCRNSGLMTAFICAFRTNSESSRMTRTPSAASSPLFLLFKCRTMSSVRWRMWSVLWERRMRPFAIHTTARIKRRSWLRAFAKLGSSSASCRKASRTFSINATKRQKL